MQIANKNHSNSDFISRFITQKYTITNNKNWHRDLQPNWFNNIIMIVEFHFQLAFVCLYAISVPHMAFMLFKK